MSAAAHSLAERHTLERNGRELLGKFFLAVLLTIPTVVLFEVAALTNPFVAIPLGVLGLGLIWVSYTTYQRRYLWDHTTIQDAQFHCTVTGPGVLKLSAVNSSFDGGEKRMPLRIVKV